MKARNIQLVLILIVLGIAILFSSTGDILNIKERVFVHAIGVDKDGETYKVSLQVFKPQGAGSDTPVDVIQSNVQVVKCEGETIREAILKAQNILGREIFLGHLQLICFGKTVDFSDPEDLFSFCLKDKNIYLGVKLCLAEDKALDLMETEITRGTMTSESFKNTIEKSIENSTTISCELIDFLSCIESHQYIAMPVLSKIEPEENKQLGGSQGGGGEEGGSSSKSLEEEEIQIKKTALIKEGKILEDSLTTDEAEAVMWLTEKAKQSEFVVDINNKKVNVKLTPDKSKIRLKNENGKLVVSAKLTMVAHTSKDISDEDQSAEVEKAVEKRMKKIFEKAEEKALYKNKTDIFGVWRMLRHSYPQGYLQYQNDLDGVFENTEFEYDLNIRTA